MYMETPPAISAQYSRGGTRAGSSNDDMTFVSVKK